VMRFSKMRITGFKSFVEPTEFSFGQGLTGIVGPNGCGKSNLVEALRWAMGENSYKNMRASGMDDVIFSGSGTRPARNMAEVGLYLDNRDRNAPAPFNEGDDVQISRRIEREKGSLYRINGKEARAKDVQLLFADQSTGARSPSMVGQGKVGELIQAKPQARRALLEEAAGISGLHSRRHEAELRLKQTEQNLERLDDVTSQLEGQIENLKRQARQAIRFKTLSSDLRKAEAMLLHLRWAEAKVLEGEAQSGLSTATLAVGAAAQRQAEAVKDQAVNAAGLPALREAEAKAGAAIQRLRIAGEQLEADARRFAARQNELQLRLSQLEADIAREQSILGDTAATLTRLDTEQAALSAADEGNGEGTTSARESQLHAAMLAASTALSAIETRHQAMIAERAEASARAAAISRALKEAGERVNRISAQLSELDRETGALNARIGTLPDPREKQADLDRTAAVLARCEAAIADSEKALDKARAAEEAARLPLQDARALRDRIDTEARTLTKLLNAQNAGLFAPVVEQVAVKRGYEKAFGIALGDDLGLPLDASAPAHWSGATIMPDDAKLPPGAEPLSNFVTAPSALARRLAQTGIVADAATGLHLMAELKPGQRLVTKDGALWRWDGVISSTEATSAAAIRLEQKNRLAELDAAAIDATRQFQHAEASLTAAKTAVGQAREADLLAREAMKAAQREVETARQALAFAERQTGELAARRDALMQSRGRLAETLDEAKTALSTHQAAQAALPDLTVIEAAIVAKSTEIVAARNAASEARLAHDGLKRENEARAQRIKLIAEDRQRWSARAVAAQTQIATLDARLVETRSELAVIDDAPDEFLEKRRALGREREQAETTRRAAADQLAVAEARQTALDRVANETLQALAETREQRGRAEERAHSAAARREETEARIAEILRVAPAAALKISEHPADAALPSAREVERDLERLRGERERLGAVNLRAEEEQNDLTKQLETLISEREDVIEAVKKLRASIQSLNREGRERLLTAFEQVNAHFQRLFTHLFGGGTAELQWIEGDDPLEAGLEILARPPGKRPQTMTLLSGGEQALTALSLIFAVFLTNPAPICVLDEVDAPLDDHNVERFCNLLDEMTATTETRFLVITHNPITMARMDRLYGVTMAEQGISQLVSVDLQTAEQIREIA
jgi:chromosome segregation protein